MGRGFVIASAALALSGCELVFGLDPSPRDGDPGGGDASGDAGGGDGAGADGSAADADPCGPFDEDADGRRDGCDSCPTTPHTGVDDDNDTLDDGCDPRIGLTDRVHSFFGFNAPLNADGWTVAFGDPGHAFTDSGTLRLVTTTQVVVTTNGDMPAAFTVVVRAALAGSSGKLAVFHDEMVNAVNLGDGRWCYLASSGAPQSYMGWEQLLDGRPTGAGGNTMVTTPATFERFTLGATRAVDGDVACVWGATVQLSTAVTFQPYHGPALYALVGDFVIDSLIVYEHL